MILTIFAPINFQQGVGESDFCSFGKVASFYLAIQHVLLMHVQVAVLV
jgi:hypothetical protein